MMALQSPFSFGLWGAALSCAFLLPQEAQENVHHASDRQTVSLAIRTGLHHSGKALVSIICPDRTGSLQASGWNLPPGVEDEAVADGLGQCEKLKTRKQAPRRAARITSLPARELMQWRPWPGPSQLSLQGGEAQSAFLVFFSLPASLPPCDWGRDRSRWGFK